MKKVLILFENSKETFSVDLLDVAEKMYKENYESYALFINGDYSKAINKFDFIIQVLNKYVTDYDFANIANIIEELQNMFDFDLILILSTFVGRMIAPRVSIRLKVGLVADIIRINSCNDAFEMIRPAFDGRLYAGVINKGPKPLMATIRPGAFTLEDKLFKETNIINYSPKDIVRSSIKRINSQEKDSEIDIRNSKIIVAGGGGIAENFDEIDELAKRLNGVKAASRKVVDCGIASRSIQIGQSGKIINPKLYIAIGIYGSLQHVAGINKVEHIIAVNTNKNAPICSIADIVVQGDGMEFLNKLIKKIDDEQENFRRENK